MVTANRTPRFRGRRFRSRRARQPQDIPIKGWGSIVFRVKGNLADNHIPIIAAGIAFYALLAIFPGLVAIASIYGLVGDPTDIQWQFSAFGSFLPGEAQMLLSKQLRRITAHAPNTLSVGVIVGVAVALWGAIRGMKAFIIALNIVYEENEKRGFLKLHARVLVLILGAIVLLSLALALIVILPILLNYLALPKNLKTLFSLLPWPLLVSSFMLSLAVLYRYGPSRSEPQWQWVSWGAVIATLLWVIGSALFSFYVASFGRYDQAYGSLGALVILVIWFFGTAYIILLGAEFNVEIERQAEIGVTRNESRPMGHWKTPAEKQDDIATRFEVRR